MKPIRLRLDRDLEIIASFLLILGYVNIGSIRIGNGRLTFGLRGPVFWRLTSGLPPYLHSPGTGLSADAYMSLEAFIAYLLLTGEAQIYAFNMVASAIVFSVTSKWFQFSTCKQIFDLTRQTNILNTKIIRAIFNLVVGLALFSRNISFVLTGVRYSAGKIAFDTTGTEIQREPRTLPSKFTLPRMNRFLHHLDQLVGALLIIQIIQVEDVLMGRGGEVAFGISGDILKLRAFPTLFERTKKS
ncbi:hypothetical protein LSG31_19470 [Fodinisporobacter ferrooxydans]|uniref:Uncharacterized protein n=1 Tax=Fodinisporobacter ferrooxydans TaxID=2901836 RepID=A0ABY4CHS5_9BACL|nr:hypothetical protein LSG31_19470 [Alicyclobacillaceae bacterium MYW30-H2]